MKVLLDTHAFIWCDSDPSQLSPTVRSVLQNSSTSVLLSIASVWEMQIKAQLGKLALRLPLPQIISQQQANGIQVLSVSLDHVFAIGTLPNAHKDPFDRLLIAQAQLEAMTLVSNEQMFDAFAVARLW